MKYLEGLNERQREAVLHREGPLLIVAGAGAGKTKTITHRIAHLIEQGVPAHHLLAVTFTNKAAGEMRERVRALIPEGRGLPLVATFHSLGVRLLREFSEEAGVVREFVIWDRDDSQKALKKILDAQNDKLPPRSALSLISREKGKAVSAREFADSAGNFREKALTPIWEAYEKALAEEGALDFDDLLLRTLTLLRNSPGVLGRLQNRWRYITIDEYQDTNGVQYEIARLLAGEQKNLCVVGDMDQCLVEGTHVTMADGTLVPIESVKKDDMVLSNYGSGNMRPARVTKTFSKKVSRELVRITLRSGRTLTSTPEHVHFAGYKLGSTPQMYFTYLMYKRGMGFRLGVSQVYSKGQRKPMVGFQMRCNNEHADSVWIVGTHATSQDARINEYKLSLQYRIPTLPFVARKGTSTGGYVHDQEVLDEIFGSFDTQTAGESLLRDRGLSLANPHHRAQGSRQRRNIVVTLCGEHRGSRPMHRISMAASDPVARGALEAGGFSVRPAQRDSPAWRFETAHGTFKELQKRITDIRALIPDVSIVRTARLGGSKKNPKDGNSLPFMPAGSVLPGMAMFDENAGYDTVEGVERIPAKNTRVHDLNIEHTHNFVANGIITHNSIYTWRGADLEHLLTFEDSFPGAKVVTLEQNYRSTRTILKAANGVIEKNVRRKPKVLFTDNPTGDPLIVYGAVNEMDEAWFVAQTAAELMQRGARAQEIAVLYRENFQSRALEEAMLHAGVPYRVLGTRFFARKEVKDVLSYLRAALNPRSRGDIARIVGVPPRGIGKVTLEKMIAGQDATLPAGVRGKVGSFRATLEAIRKATEMLSASEAVRFAVEASGVEKMFKDGGEEGKERLGNVRELANFAVRFDDLRPPEGVERLLEEAALQSDQDQLEEKQQAVSLMTVHASKGLEFDAVFITGLEQGLFPSMRDDPAPSAEGAGRDPEEERRLFYVALTRARKLVYLTYAGQRMKYGSREFTLPSEFIGDIDPRLLTAPAYVGEQAEKVIEL